MAIYHYFDSLTNTNGDSLPGFRVRVLDSGGAVKTLWADENGTPIASVSGYADTALVDEEGNYSLFIETGTYTLEISDPAGTPLKYVRYVNMEMGPPGPPGSADNVAATLDQLKAAETTNVSMIYDTATFNWTLGNYTGQADDINIVKQDDTPLTTGAWVRQQASSISYTAGGTLPATVPLSAKQAKSTIDKAGTDVGAALNAWNTDLADGGEVTVPLGTQTVGTAVEISRDRMRVVGEGATILQYEGSGTAVTYTRAGSGGIYQTEFSGHRFYSTNSSNKTAVAAINAASIDISYIGIATGGWPGADSVGIMVQGREFADVHHNVIACARPFVARKNDEHPTLSLDHAQLRKNHWVSTSASHAAMEFNDGVVLSNTTIRDTALVGGEHGFVGVNTTQVGSSFGFRISNTRVEQGLSATGYSYYLNYVGPSGSTLQSFLFDNNRADNTRNGLLMRGVQRAALVASMFGQGSGKTAIDDVMIANSSRTLIECLGQVAGTRTVVNGHKLIGSRSQATNDPIGPLEHWQYFAAPADPGGGGLFNFDAVPVLEFGSVRTASFSVYVPTGSRTIRLPILPGMTVDADVVARGPNGRIELTYLVGGTQTVRDATGLFASTPTTGKVYPVSQGFVSDTIPQAFLMHVEIRS